MNPDEFGFLHEQAVALAKQEAALLADGVGIAAACLTESGSVLRGIPVDGMVDSACLCAETGPICEATLRRDRIVASICVMWTREEGSRVLAACGVCQERLAVFGRDVVVGVAASLDTTDVEFRSLDELRPQPWWDAVAASQSPPGAPDIR